MNAHLITEIEALKKSIRDIPDFPKKGILFKDVTTLLKDRVLFKKAIQLMAEPFQNKNIDVVVGIESRGFFLGGALSLLLNASFVPIRKKGKLPSKTHRVTYALEYGEDAIEIHQDAFSNGKRAIVVDDLLATGGTLVASCELIEKAGGKIVGISSLIELEFLHGRAKLSDYNLHSVLKF